MSQVFITQYLAELDRLRKVSGSGRETIVREAFKDLLKAWGRTQDLTFVAEYPLKTATKSNIAVDGALLHSIRTPLGWWEAKDADDDLDAEIAAKFRKGYPKDNIVFSDDVTAALWQGGSEVLRCAMDDTAKLEKLLKLFFGYERPEIASFRQAVEQFKTDLPAVLNALRAMIERQQADNPAFRRAARRFLKHAQEAINPGLGEADVCEMLIQHVLTEEIFAKVFDDSDFHRKNNVAHELYVLEETFFTGGLKRDTLKGLETYYAAIRTTAAQIGSHQEKQTFLKVIYENFYKVYNAKAADRLGVVYTPGEIVRFMIDGADWLCEQHFGKSLIDRGVDILDPATGTGTFVCELLEHFRGQDKKLAHKYKEELHANEVAILPYYVANLNIEATFAAITGRYEEFANLCFVDTLDNVGLHTQAHGTTADLFGSVSDENVARIKRQNARRISVVIGNPPYNANQANENDNNKNREYPAIDARIKQTYIAESTAQKTKLYDMYARFYRWASDRLDANGVLAFVTNRSFLDSRTFDGFRKTVAGEFAEVRVVDLGGDVRANPKLSGTRHNVFGIQTGVAIAFFVKKPRTTRDHRCRNFYTRRPELETADEKLAWLGQSRLARLASEEIRPDAKGNWLDLTHNDFDDLLPVIDKDAKAKAVTKVGRERAVFKLFGNGINTARDDWVTDYDSDDLQRKVEFFLAEYSRHDARSTDLGTLIKWSRNLKTKLGRGMAEEFGAQALRRYAYRPFLPQYGYLSRLLIDELGQWPAFDGPGNRSINFPAGKAFCCLASDLPTDFHFTGDTKTASLYRYENGERLDNISDWARKQFTQHYKAGTGKRLEAPTKAGIFHYVYAVLHDPVYREKYALNLKREFPRIPLHGSTRADFWRWAGWGEQLMKLHIGYETVEPHPLKRIDTPDTKARTHQDEDHSPKPLLRSEPEVGRILIDSETTLTGVPPEAWTYRLGNRSAIDWVLDQHKEKKPKDPTIREKFDTYRLKDHRERVIELLGRVVAVSVETVRIVGEIEGDAR